MQQLKAPPEPGTLIATANGPMKMYIGVDPLFGLPLFLGQGGHVYCHEQIHTKNNWSTYFKCENQDVDNRYFTAARVKILAKSKFTDDLKEAFL